MGFDARKVTNDLIIWIRDWFSVNGRDCNAVLGISGGKDSTVVAALCVRALGKNRVIGVMMPNGVQADISDSIAVCSLLGIRSYTINIQNAYKGIMDELESKLPAVTPQTVQNLPPRLRMATVYAVSQSMNGRVANTCNLSEDWVGYSTRYGDSVGDFSPLSKLTVSEVRQIGDELGLPYELVHKVPIDGLCGKSDEDNLGFSYDVLDRYIRTGLIDDEQTKDRIDTLHQRNLFKLQLMPCFPYEDEGK